MLAAIIGFLIAVWFIAIIIGYMEIAINGGPKTKKEFLWAIVPGAWACILLYRKYQEMEDD